MGYFLVAFCRIISGSEERDQECINVDVVCKISPDSIRVGRFDYSHQTRHRLAVASQIHQRFACKAAIWYCDKWCVRPLR